MEDKSCLLLKFLKTSYIYLTYIWLADIYLTWKLRLSSWSPKWTWLFMLSEVTNGLIYSRSIILNVSENNFSLNHETICCNAFYKVAFNWCTLDFLYHFKLEPLCRQFICISITIDIGLYNLSIILQ